MPEGWISEQETVEDESGALITHFEASCKAGDSVDIYVGPLPEDTTARDQAMSNYADMVGFDDDDPEDFDPIAEWTFNGRKAFGFKALCEDDSPMLLMCYEPKKDVLCIVCAAAHNDKALEDTMVHVERSMRIKTQ